MLKRRVDVFVNGEQVINNELPQRGEEEVVTTGIHFPYFHLVISRSSSIIRRQRTCPQTLALDPDTSADPVTVELILPRGESQSAWNKYPCQHFEPRSSWNKGVNPLDLAMNLLPRGHSDGKVHRLSSPFENFQVDPDYPYGLHFSPGVHSRFPFASHILLLFPLRT